ncbi:Uncharacterised protein [Bordetella pertussis]|nr:Uncharacterised protein [Bordetella pertussis]
MSSSGRWRFRSSLRVANAKRWRSKSAQMPVPRMREPKAVSLRRPLRRSSIRCSTRWARSGKCACSQVSKTSFTSQGRRSTV